MVAGGEEEEAEEESALMAPSLPVLTAQCLSSMVTGLSIALITLITNSVDPSGRLHPVLTAISQ